MLFGKYVNRFYLKYFFNFFIGILFLVLIDIVQLYVPELIASLTTAYDLNELTVELIQKTCLYIFLIAIFMFIGRFLWRVMILSGAFRISADLRAQMFEKSERLSQNYYRKNKVGGIMSYYTNDLDTIQEAYGWGTVMLVDSLFMGVLSFYKMLKVNWQLSLVCAIPLIILCIAAYFIDRKMEQIYDQRQEAFEKMSDYAQELFTGLRVIKAFVRERREAIRFREVNRNNKEKELSLVKFSALLDTLISILIEGMVVIGLSIGAYFVYQTFLKNPAYHFSRADMIEFNGYFNLIIWPMIALGQIVALRSRAKTSLKRVSSFLDETVDVKETEFPRTIEDFKGGISFRHFSYRYPDGTENVLNDLTLDFKPGEMIGIVGRIGSGKSTLVHCLLRLDNVEKGTVYFDGIDLMDLEIAQVRNMISFVPQDSFLFSTTVENNIAFSDENLSEEQIIAAAEFADVDHNIKDFLNGYKTLIGERGVTLSGGQKQRLSIARAYAKNSPVMILDDSVSAVDVKTEEKILANIREKRKGKTTILVSSRVSTVRNLDRILVLNDGKAEAFDTHDALMKISPTYQKMVHLQELKDETEWRDF